MEPAVRYSRKPVEIRIVTDGTAANTRISLEGVEQKNLLEWSLTIRGRKMVLLSGERENPVTHLAEFFSFYGPAAFERLGAKAERVTDADLIGCGVRNKEA